MGSFYLGIACLALFAAAIVGMVIYAMGILGALAVFGLTAILCGLLYAGINLIHG